MKKGNKKTIILFLIILIIGLCGGTFFITKILKQKDNLLVNISDYRIFQDRQIEYYIDNLYFLRNSKGFIEVYENDEKYSELDSTGKINKIDKTNNGYIVYLNDGTYILSNNKMVMYKRDNIIDYREDYVSKNIYYIEKYVDRVLVYDSQFKIIMEFIENVDINCIVGNKVYLNDKRVYDLNSKEQLDSYISLEEMGEKYYLITYNNKIELIDKSNGSIRITDNYSIKNRIYEFNFNNEKIVIDSNGTLYEDINKYQINDNYYLDGSKCNGSWIVRNNKDQSMYDICSLSYDVSHLDDKVLIVENNNGKYKLIANDEETNEYDVMEFQGEYVLASNGNKKIIYDFNGNVTFNSFDDIKDFIYIGNDNYVLKTSDSIKIVNSNEKIEAIYDDIKCDNNICITVKNNKYGLYYNGKQQIDNEYLEINKYDNVYVLKDIAFDLVIKLEHTKKSKNISEIKELKNNYYKEINIDEIIDKYRLDNLRNDINKDSELFQKYSYVLEHNNKIGIYRGELYRFYKAIIDNKAFLDEDTLLYALRELKIVEKDILSISGAAAVYLDDNKEIEIDVNETIPAVYYHELYHFLDHNINRVKHNEEYPKTKIITEAGAEIYSSDYFISTGRTTAYKRGTYIYQILSYILGYDVMKGIYYSPDTDYEFYNLIVNKLNMSKEDYNNMLEIFNKLSEINALEDYDSLKIARDYLVYLYSLKYPDSNYKNDTELLYYLKYGAGNDIYSEPYKNILHNINESILIDIYGIRKGYNISEFKVKNEGTYIYFNVLDRNYSIIEYIRVLYDFDNDKIIEYKMIEGV